MKKSNLIKLGDAIDDFLKAEKLDVRLSRHAVKNDWESIVGKPIATHTTDVFFKDTTVYISINSSVFRNELAYQKQEILNKINHYCGTLLVKEVVLK